ncbi:MAG: nucleotidyltransferase family protein [Myxococcales bacterium]|nr:nucleotidyltransferase family protein [Myxococcales bacterium]
MSASDTDSERTGAVASRTDATETGRRARASRVSSPEAEQRARAALRSVAADPALRSLLRELARDPALERARRGLYRLADDAARFDAFVLFAEQQQVEGWLAFHGLTGAQGAAGRYTIEATPNGSRGGGRTAGSASSDFAASGTPGARAASWNRLRAVRERALYQSLLLEQASRPLLATFVDQRLPFVVLKGLHLAQTVYPASWVRSMSDIDILIRVEDRERFEGVLRRHGFRRQPVCPERPFKNDVVHERAWVHRLPNGAPLMVEVHTALANEERFFIDHAALFARAEPFAYAGLELRGLCTTDLFCHVLLHIAASHYFQGSLRGLVDLLQIYEVRPLDWEAVRARCRSWGCATIAWAVLDALRGTFGVDVPEPTLRRLRPSWPKRVWSWGWLRDTAPPLYRFSHLDRIPLAQLVMFWPLLDTAGQRWRMLVRDLHLRALDWALR